MFDASKAKMSVMWFSLEVRNTTARASSIAEGHFNTCLEQANSCSSRKIAQRRPFMVSIQALSTAT